MLIFAHEAAGIASGNCGVGGVAVFGGEGGCGFGREGGGRVFEGLGGGLVWGCGGGWGVKGLT